jgi:hypothetical protein
MQLGIVALADIDRKCVCGEPGIYEFDGIMLQERVALCSSCSRKVTLFMCAVAKDDVELRGILEEQVGRRMSEQKCRGCSQRDECPRQSKTPPDGEAN